MAGGTTLARGNVLNTIILQVSLTPVSVAATTTAEQSFTVPGLLVGDQISALQLQSAYPNNLVDPCNFRVGSNNTLTVAYQNGTAGALTPPAGLYYIEVNRIENLPPPASLI